MDNKQLLRATHGSDKTRIRFGNISIPCYVLDNGKRVLSGKGMQDSLGFDKKASGTALGKFLSRTEILDLTPADVQEKLKNRIEFARKGSGGAASKTYGYDADLLVDLCDVLIEAKNQKVLTPGQLLLAEQAEIIMRSVAKVGIIALIDEVTGYQYDRKKDELSLILEAYIAKELLPWAKRFPDEFYQEMFRLRGWQYPTIGGARPGVVGKWTNDIVYERMPQGVLAELREKNPKDTKGRFKNKHHQYLTPEIGNIHLEKHLTGVIALMRASANWDNFKRSLARAYPKPGEQIPLDI